MASVYPPPAPKPARPKPPTKRKKPSLMNMMETNPKRIGKTAVPKQGRSPYSPGAAAAAKGYEVEAARAAAQTARGQSLPQRPRKKKMGMGN